MGLNWSERMICSEISEAFGRCFLGDFLMVFFVKQIGVLKCEN